jgi:ATP-binding cassette subfamily B protein
LSRRFFAPEVVQTSALDCGPAALKCLLEGFGIPVSYGRLREACQTGIDGTSIDTMETVANQLGLEAEQVMIPPDHLLLPESNSLPALVVVRLPNGLTHFVVLWNRIGSMLQVMDPALGRRWVGSDQFLKDLYRHTIEAGAEDWRGFAGSVEFQAAVQARFRAIGISRKYAIRFLAEASANPGWGSFAAADAALRFVAALVHGGAIPRGRTCAAMFENFVREPALIPDRYWSVKDAGTERLMVAGAVLVRIKRRRGLEVDKQQLTPELAAAISEKRVSPARALGKAFLECGPWSIGLFILALAAAAGGTVFEAMLFRVLLDVSSELGLSGQRLGAVTAIILFGVALLLLELPCFAMGMRLGRQVEMRMRLLFLEKIPKLGDRYFRSRLTSDMAERSHVTHRLRHLPDQARQILRAAFELCTTAAGILWLAPASWPYVLAIAGCALLPPFFMQPSLAERDLRLRTYGGTLTRFFLDAMLGMLAIRNHGADRSLRRDQEGLLGEWTDAAVRLQRTVVATEAVQLMAIYALIAALLLSRPAEGGGIGGMLLLVYWVLNLPVLGQDLAALMRQYPYYRNVTLRLLDPLGAPEETMRETASQAIHSAPAIEFRAVGVRLSEQTILEHIDLRIAPGSHLAIVGPSGAGKSSLISLLLGWLNPSVGDILVNGEPLDCERLRRSTAWVDPAVQLWNRSLVANLSYGNDAAGPAIAQAIDASLLRKVLESLPQGMQTALGEGGALVSGGEGQRVRLARALLSKDARLVILDEPFRGLDREKRRELMKRARHFWRDCTLICITHDLAETESFDSVAVIESGRIVQQGCPGDLVRSNQSRYRQLLDAEDEARTAVWSGSFWRRVHVHNGRVAEDVSRHAEEAVREAEVA